MRAYESVFILNPGLSKDSEEKVVSEIQEVIVRHKGEIIQKQSWGKRKLASRLKKQNEGIYFFCEFKLSPATVKKIENIFKINETILRTLILRKEI